MEGPVKKTPRRVLRWTTRLLGGGLALTVLLFFGSNLFLATGWGRSLLIKQVSRRAPALTWAVESASWSPWNGFSLKGLSARIPNQPQSPALLTLPSARLQPYWSQALRGRRIFRELVLESPEINLPIEALFVVAPQTQPSLAPEEKQPSTPQEAAPPEPETGQNPPPTPPPTPHQGESARPKSTPQTPAEEKPPPARPTEPVVDPRLWLRIRNARVQLYSLSNGHQVVAEGLNINLPLAGPAAKGSIAWEKMALNQATLSPATQLAIAWDEGRWVLAPTALPLTIPQRGQRDQLAPLMIHTQLAGSLAVRGPGKPFTLQGYLPPQALEPYCLQDQAELVMSAPEMSANFTSSGRLTDLASWRCESLAAIDSLDISSQIRGQHFLFESARSQVLLRQGVLQAPLLALRSEQLSFLGNGELSLGGYLLGVLRVVASPELEDEITRIAIGSFLSRGWTSHWMRPLDTPDRYFRDLHIEGMLPEPQINLGRNGEFLAASQVIELLQRFLDQEVAEEPGHQPIPKP